MTKSKNYILTIPMTNEAEVIRIREELKSIFGWVRLRGRHSNRKSVLGNKWKRTSQNDIPWQQAERIAIYIHPQNPRYFYMGSEVFYKDGVAHQSIFGSSIEVKPDGGLVNRIICGRTLSELIQTSKNVSILNLN